MCGLSLAWVTSENSTMLLESDILRLFFTGPYLVSSPLCSVSGIDCPSILPRQLLFCCLPLCSPWSPRLSARCLVLTAPPWSPAATRSLLSCHQLSSLLSNYQLFLPLSASRRQLSFSGPLTTSGYGEISCPRILCLVSRQNRLVCFGGLPP